MATLLVKYILIENVDRKVYYLISKYMNFTAFRTLISITVLAGDFMPLW
jgi:hypothetical protein